VVGLSDAQLAAFGVSYTPQAIAEPGSLALLLSASVGLLTAATCAVSQDESGCPLFESSSALAGMTGDQ
jgi:hypothetical protein